MRVSSSSEAVNGRAKCRPEGSHCKERNLRASANKTLIRRPLKLLAFLALFCQTIIRRKHPVDLSPRFLGCHEARLIVRIPSFALRATGLTQIHRSGPSEPRSARLSLKPTTDSSRVRTEMRRELKDPLGCVS